MGRREHVRWFDATAARRKLIDKASLLEYAYLDRRSSHLASSHTTVSNSLVWVREGGGFNDVIINRIIDESDRRLNVA